MSLGESVLLGMLQGVLEWLPVSSTGGLVIVMVEFLGYAAERATSLSFFLHLGTALSAVLYFRRDVRDILAGLGRYRPGFAGGNGLVSFLILTSLISGALGFAVYAVSAEYAVSGELLLGMVGVALIATGLVQRFVRQTGLRSSADLNLRDSVLLGVVQAFSAIPGLSRSGVTISALLLRGYRAQDALRLSFLMGIPAVLGAQAGLVAVGGIPDVPAADLAAGLAASFAAGYLSIGVLLRIAGRVRFWLFAVIMGSVALLSLVNL